MTRAVDLRAVALGATVVVAVALPLAVADVVARDDGEAGPLSLLAFVGTLVVFVVGGHLAARRAPASPYSTSALAALAGYVVVAAIGVASRTIRGDGVSITRIAFNGLLAYACGLLGGALASRRAGKEAPQP
ncbi:MAG TPA: hypothetical protein VMN58_05820 [Acidimicrobiales bacterium]|nr:hypothetical protein [Acidimicrobiales bacterium]